MRSKALLVAILVLTTLLAGCASAKSKMEERYAAGLRPFTLTGLEKARMTLVWEQSVLDKDAKARIRDIYIYKDLVLAGDNKGFITAFNRYTGNFAWLAQVPLPFKFAPTLFGETFYGVCGDRLVSVSMSGKVEIGATFDMSPSAAPVITADFVFAPGADRGIHKLDIVKLAEVWPAPSDSAGPIVSAPQVIGSYIAYGNTAGEIGAVDMVSGGRQVNWKARDSVAGGVAVDEDFIYAGSTDFYAYSLTLNNTLRWKTIVQGQVARAPVLSGDILYVEAMGAGLQQLDKKTGEVNWKNPQAEWFISDGGGYVFATGPKKELWLLDSATGETLERLDISEFDILPRNTLNDGLVFLANRSGRLVCLRAL